MLFVDYFCFEGIVIIMLNNVSVNIYSYEMMREIDIVVLQVRFDDDVYVIIVRGVGECFFCVGVDIFMFDVVIFVFKYVFCLHVNETMLWLEYTLKLVIAVFNGYVVGGGLEVVMVCDICLGKVGGGKVGLFEVNLGVFLGIGGMQWLV